MDSLNKYRIMWILVFFDLPTETKQDRKNYSKFRDRILDDGFIMFQFSLYMRHCPSRENAQVHIERVKKIVPPKGHIGILCITDKQFGDIILFNNQQKEPMPSISMQLEMF